MTVNELIEKLQKLKEEHGDRVGELDVFIRQLDINENGKAIEIMFEDEGEWNDGVWIECEDLF